MTMKLLEFRSYDELVPIVDDVRKTFDETTYRDPLSDHAHELRRTHARHFDQSQSPSGSPWREWYWRSVDAPNDHKTLVVSGRLRQSVIADGPDHVERVEDRELAFGTSVPYAATHQEGASLVTAIPLVGRNGGYLPAGTKINIPARPFLGMNEETTQQLVEAAADHAVEELLP